MQGTILSISYQGNVAIISGDDGNRYNFDAGQWRTNYAPTVGQRVDFVPVGNVATEVYLVQNQFTNTVTDKKSKVVAGLLAIFLGSLGIHKFYLGYHSEGIVMLVMYLTGFFLAFGLVGFLWVWIPGIIGLIEAIIYFTKSDYDFEQTYVVGNRPWF